MRCERNVMVWCLLIYCTMYKFVQTVLIYNLINWKALRLISSFAYNGIWPIHIIKEIVVRFWTSHRKETASGRQTSNKFSLYNFVQIVTNLITNCIWTNVRDPSCPLYAPSHFPNATQTEIELWIHSICNVCTICIGSWITLKCRHGV